MVNARAALDKLFDSPVLPKGYRVTVAPEKLLGDTAFVPHLWVNGQPIFWRTGRCHEFKDIARQDGIEMAWQHYNANKKEEADESVRAFNRNLATGYFGIDGWMAPDGRLHRAPEESHDTWAANWLRKRYPNIKIHDPTADMYALGWVRIVYEPAREDRTLYVSHGDKPPNKAQLAEAEYIAIERSATLILDSRLGSSVIYTPPKL